MAKHANKQTSLWQLRSGAVITLISCSILALLVCILAVLIISPHSEPHFFRGLFIGLRDIFLSEKMVAWYETNALAPMIVNLLCLIPFLGMVVSIWCLFNIPALFQRIGRTIQTSPSRHAGNEDPDKESPLPTPSSLFGHHAPAPSDCETWLAQQRQQVNALHQELKNACEKDSFNLENEPLPLIRVQDFTIKNEKDYILSWNQNGYAFISVSSNVEITLALNPDRKPFILGSSDQTAPQQLTGYPLVLDEPLSIYRDGGSNPIRHYTITWIGGGPLC